MKKTCALCGSIDDKGVLKTCGSCGEATWIPLAEQAPLMPKPEEFSEPEPPVKKKGRRG